MQYQLDTTQYRCPLPLLMVKKALSDLQVGDELCVLLNAESTIADFQLLCESVSCEVIFDKGIFCGQDCAESRSDQFALIMKKSANW